MKLFHVLNVYINFYNTAVIALKGFSFPLYADVLLSIKDVSEVECIEECISRFECKSLTVKPGDICILYPYVNNSEIPIGDAHNFTYFERTEFAASYEGGCKHLVCGSGQKCVADSGCGCVKCKTDGQTVYSDCGDYADAGYTSSGLYRLQLTSLSLITWCQFGTGEPLTYIQRRYDGSVNFNRTWREYELGFGHPDGEFWIGNANIHQLTKGKNRSIVFNMETVGGRWKSMLYNGFEIADVNDEYRLSSSVVLQSGDIEDALFVAKGCGFTTPDRDNDNALNNNCGILFAAGWWFNGCHRANVNGPYCYDCSNYDYNEHIFSWRIDSKFEPLKSIVMAIY